MKLGIIVLIISFFSSYAMEPCKSAGMFPSFEQLQLELEQTGLSQQIFAECRRLVIARANEELFAQNREAPEIKNSNGKRVKFCLTEAQIEKIQQREIAAVRRKVSLVRSEFERKVRAEQVPEFTKKICALMCSERNKKKGDKQAKLHAVLQLTELLAHLACNLEIRDANERTPLLYAAQAHMNWPMQVLIAHGADVNAKDSFGWTVLANVIYWLNGSGYPKGSKIIAQCRFLMHNGACIEASAFRVADGCRDSRVTTFLVRHFLQVPEHEPVKKLTFDAQRLSELKDTVIEARENQCFTSGYFVSEEFFYKKCFEQSVRDLLDRWPLDDELFL